MKIGFALIPNKETSEKIIEVENKLHDIAEFMDMLGENVNRPHITLFQGEFRDDFDYENVASEIVKYIKKHPNSNELMFTMPIYISKGWYFLKCRKTYFLQNLHKLVLTLCADDVMKDVPNANYEILTKSQIY